MVDARRVTLTGTSNAKRPAQSAGRNVCRARWSSVRQHVGFDPADHADMAAPAPSHHSDGADLRPGDPPTVVQIAEREIAAAFVAGLLEHHVHERTAP